MHRPNDMHSNILTSGWKIASSEFRGMTAICASMDSTLHSPFRRVRDADDG